MFLSRKYFLICPFEITTSTYHLTGDRYIFMKFSVSLQIGQALIDDNHYASKDVSDTLNKLNYQWADLYERARDKVK